MKRSFRPLVTLPDRDQAELLRYARFDLPFGLGHRFRFGRRLRRYPKKFANHGSHKSPLSFGKPRYVENFDFHRRSALSRRRLSSASLNQQLR